VFVKYFRPLGGGQEQIIYFLDDLSAGVVGMLSHGLEIGYDAIILAFNYFGLNQNDFLFLFYDD